MRGVRLWGGVAGVALALAGGALAQQPPDPVAGLRKEVRRLQSEGRAVRLEVVRLRDQASAARTAETSEVAALRAELDARRAEAEHLRTLVALLAAVAAAALIAALTALFGRGRAGEPEETPELQRARQRVADLRAQIEQAEGRLDELEQARSAPPPAPPDGPPLPEGA